MGMVFSRAKFGAGLKWISRMQEGSRPVHQTREGI